MKKLILALIISFLSFNPVQAKRLNHNVSEEIWKYGTFIHGPSWTDNRPGKDASFYTVSAWIRFNNILYYCVLGSVSNQQKKHFGFNAQCRDSVAE